eukprot:6165566-Pyramimonas_sp.AAC.1
MRLTWLSESSDPLEGEVLVDAARARLGCQPQWANSLLDSSGRILRVQRDRQQSIPRVRSASVTEPPPCFGKNNDACTCRLKPGAKAP